MPFDVPGEGFPARSVLIVEDDAVLRETLRLALSRQGCHVAVAQDAQEGLHLAVASPFDVILLDMILPGLGGEEVLMALRPLGLKSRVVVMSANPDPRWQAEVRNLGAAATLEKPLHLDHLISLLEQLTHPGGGEGKEEATRDGSSFWAWVIRTIFSNTSETFQKKAVGLGLIVGMGLLMAWTLFGRRI